MQIKVVPLGAGQDVGKSCILVTIGGKNIMLDCGMHPGYSDNRRFPDFRYISKEGNFTSLIDLVIISHFHLDHCGSLPYFTQTLGYDGPIYATHPTKAVMPILLEDYRKITVEKRGVDEKDFFTSQNVRECMAKVIPCVLEETVTIEPDFQIRPYYAGHVLGAAMFYVRVGQESFLYTGDYNMTPDRHLGSARCDKLRPDLLITESTYATTIRESKRWRERDLLEQVSQCVRGGGKVLIPVFALGRAQELCLLLDAFWERTGLGATVPIYFSAGLTEKANWYYKMFISWTNQKIKNTFVDRNVFDFKYIKPFDRALIDQPGPMVLFATPGMLHGGLSMEVFKKWAPGEQNLVIMPGYCVAGTLGHKVLANGGKPQVIDIPANEGGGKLHVRCKIKHLSFSAHADAKGIMTLIKQVEPAKVMLVHGEKKKMKFLKARIEAELGLQCFDPANGTTSYINTPHPVPALLSPKLMSRKRAREGGAEGGVWSKRLLGPSAHVPLTGILCMKDPTNIKVVDASEAADLMSTPECHLTLRHSFGLAAGTEGPEEGAGIQREELWDELVPRLERQLQAELESNVTRSEDADYCTLAVKSVKLQVGRDGDMAMEYGYKDLSLAEVVWAATCTALRITGPPLPTPTSSSAANKGSTRGAIKEELLMPSSPSCPPPSTPRQTPKVKKEKVEEPWE